MVVFPAVSFSADRIIATGGSPAGLFARKFLVEEKKLLVEMPANILFCSYWTQCDCILLIF